METSLCHTVRRVVTPVCVSARQTGSKRHNRLKKPHCHAPQCDRGRLACLLAPWCRPVSPDSQQGSHFSEHQLRDSQLFLCPNPPVFILPHVWEGGCD